jgi:S1-C subfamily serine protease
MASQRLRLPLTSIVKVTTSRSSPHYLIPWQNKLPSEVTGSAFAIRDLDGNRRLMTNAHVVADYTRVLVRRHGAVDKFPARCVSVGHECDLALLDVPDEAFWHGVEPLEFGPVPELRDVVTVVGFPTDNITVTSGVVSRVDTVQYVHAAARLLAVQIDASINPGNSGGPAFNTTGQVAGVAFQNVPDAQSVGYLIPLPIVHHFLKDYQNHGRYVGFCKLGIHLQTLENGALRAQLGLSADQSGIAVNSVQPICAAMGVLQKRDVIVAVDGMPIANDGTFEWREGERIFVDFLVTIKSVGEAIRLSVLREGSPLELEVTAGTGESLVPVHQYGELPEFFMYAGLVFSPLVQPMLHEFGMSDWYNQAPRKLVDKAIHGLLDKDGQQVVVLCQVLPDEANSGYEGFAGMMVESANGQPVHNLQHLADIVRGCTDEFVSLELEGSRFVALRTATAAEATARIQKRHRIARPSWLRAEDAEKANGNVGTLDQEPLSASQLGGG